MSRLELGLSVLVVLLLCIDGWGCAGRAESSSCQDEAYGWICDAACSECYCSGSVRAADDGRGECVEEDQ